jgi:hypothetical protein
MAGLDRLVQHERAELPAFPVQQVHCSAHLAICLPVLRVHHPRGLGNFIGGIVDQAVKIIMLAHLAEKFFL